MSKPTPPEKLAKQQRLNLLTLCNRITSSWSLKKITKWEDVYAMSGTPPNPKSGSLTFPELKVYLESLKKDLETVIASRAAQPPPARDVKPLVTGVDMAVGKDKSVVSVVDTTGTVAQVTMPTQVAERGDESGIMNADDYGLPINPFMKAFLFWFQKKAVKEILDAFLGFDVSTCADIHELKDKWLLNKANANPKRGMLLLAATGTGKTFIAAATLRYLYDIGFHEDLTMGHTYYLYVTRASIVEQTKRVFQLLFGLDMKCGVEVVNIEQLRSRAGEVWIRDELKIIEGKEVRVWKWKAVIAPCVIFWDESQGLKNDGSLQNEIAVAYNNIPNNTYQLFISATPFTRICEAKCFCVSTRKVISDIIGTSHQTKLVNDNWPTYASSVAYPAGPDEYNEAAVERMTKDMDKYIVRVKGVRPQFDAINKIEMITFETPEEREYYNKAWERYLEEKRKLEALGVDSPGATGNSQFQILVQFLKFRMAAEFCRRRHLAKKLFDTVQSGKAACAALNFKGTMIAVVRILVEEYAVSRDAISLVWGGGQTALTKKQKMKRAILEKKDQLEAAGMSIEEMLNELDLDQVEDRIMEDLPEHLRLGPQSKDERQREIDRFQAGKSLYCLYTFRAGGVGLSLHHTDEMTRVKARRQKNGYAVVEDIPKVPVRARKNFVAPTYSAIELVQGLGRCPRLTSLSDTEQVLLFYRGTIEEEVAHVVSQKLRCLSRVVRQREKWEDVVLGGVKADAHIDVNAPDEKGTNYDDLNAGDEEDEENGD